MTVTITSVAPGLGDWTRAVTIELTGTGFAPGVVVSLVSQTTPPVTYNLTQNNYISSTTIRALIVANSVPTGIYDVVANNGGGDTFTLPQSYRSAPQLPADPFTGQTFDTLMARIMSNLNPPTAPMKYDTRVGQVPWDLTAPVAAVMSDLWRNLWQIMLQGFSQYTGGSLLQLRAEEHGIIKKTATFATGVIQTTAPVGTQIPPTITAATVATAVNPTGIQTFHSTETITKTQYNPDTGTVSAATSGTLTDSTKNWTVNQWQNAYVWIRSGTGAGQIRKIQSNTATVITPYTAWGTGAVPDATSQYTIFSGFDAQADISGVNGNVLANSIIRMTSVTQFVTGVSNPLAFSGGADSETDAQLLSRLLLAVRSPSTGGNVYDYQTWAKATPGVNLGSVSVIPVWNGAGTVKVVIINADNTIPSSSVVGAVQNYIDPVLGQGLGKAPIGASVTVQGATSAAIDVSVAITIATGVQNAATVRNQVYNSIAYYLNNVPVGQNVLLTQVENAIINSLVDANGNYVHNASVQDFDLLSAGHGIRRSGSPTWTTANIAILGTEKPITGTITVS